MTHSAKSLKWLEFGSKMPGPLGSYFHSRTRPIREADAFREFEAVLDTLGPDDICLDLSANVGLMTKMMADTGASVHAFEPDPTAFAALEAAVGHRDNVILHNAAIGVTDGLAMLNRAKNYESDPLRKSLGSSVVRTDGWSMDKRLKVEIPVIGLFAFLETLPRPARIIKMDIEGAEWELLEQMESGLGLDRFEHLFVETHERFNTWVLMPRLRRYLRFSANTNGPNINLYWK
jgi:FkbM family methyltransferase